jgi:two-component system cell cycle sensor histidine kinase/response regulator CckA
MEHSGAMSDDGRFEPSVGSRLTEENSEGPGTRRRSEPALGFRIDLDWRLHAAMEAFLPEGAKLARRLEGQDIREICADQPHVIDAISSALAGESTTSLVTFPGSAIETSYLPDRDDSGSIVGVRALSIDVTDRERALQELREQEALLRSFAQSSTELVSIQDLSGRIIWANDYHEKLFGVPPAELVGVSALSLVRPEDRMELARKAESISQQPNSDRMTFRIHARDDRIVWLSSTARTFVTGDGARQFLTVAHDVTKQVELQERLERQVENDRRVSKLSRYLMSLPPLNLADAVQETLEEIAQLAGADHTTLIFIQRGEQPGFARYDWPNDTDGIHRPDTSRESLQRSSGTIALLAEGKTLRIPKVSELSYDSDANREDLERRGVKSNLTIPLLYHDRVLGFQIFENRQREIDWSDDDVARLRLLGEVLARAVERHHDQANLIASEEKFRALSENMTDVVLEIDKVGNLVWASPSFKDSLGIEPESIIGNNMNSLIHPDDLPETRRALGRALNCIDVAHSSYRMRHADGRWLWFETRGRGFQTSSGEVHFVGHTRDITEQRELIEGLERRHHADREIARLSSLFLRIGAEGLDEGLSEGIESVVEVAGADRAYLLDMTRRPRRIVPSSQWTQSEIDRAVAGEDSDSRGRFKWAIDRLARGEALQISDASTLHGDASAVGADLVSRGVRALLGIPILSDGRLMGYLGIEYLADCREWTDRELSEVRMLAGVFAGALQRRRAERALAEQLEFERRVSELSQQLLGVSSEGLEEAITGMLAAVGDLADVDRAFLLSFPVNQAGSPRASDVESFQWCAPGITPTIIEPSPWKLELALKHGPMAITRVDAMPEEQRTLRDRLQKRGVRSFFGLPIQTQGGFAGFLGLEAHQRTRRFGAQQRSMLQLLAEIVGSATRRLRAEQALRDSQQQLMHAQKMDAVGTLAGGIAHDFNNLLTVILGFSESMLMELGEGHRLRPEAEAIVRAADRAAALTSQLLTFSRRQSSLSQPADLAEVTEGMRTLLERLLGADFELVFEAADAPYWALVDAAQVEQAVVNLVVNARDAMPDGGRIVLTLTSEQLGISEVVRFGLQSAGRYQLLEVQDAGVGIKPDLMERIYEPFYTTKPAGKGTGLGLSIVYSVLRAHEGGVSVESTEGVGTRFTLAFPATESVERAEPRQKEEVVAAGKETILLAEDEDLIRDLVVMNLERAGYRVIASANGEEALARIEEEGIAGIDLLLTDIVMPGINGGELARRVRELDPKIPVLYVSGHPQDRGPAERSPNLPSGRYLTKPFEKAQLLSEIRLTIEGQP